MKYFLLLLLSFEVMASDKIYRIKDRSVIMSLENGIIANRDCLQNKTKCQAWKKAVQFGKTKQASNGKNPAAEKCKHILKGEVVVGTDEAQNENSFCEFSDKSIISCSSLEHFNK